MERSSKTSPNERRTRRKVPMRTPEAREGRLVNLAMDRAEEMLEKGTAPTGVLVHFLKVGEEKTRLERARIEADTKLAIAKIEIMESQKRSEEIAAKALEAFKSYAGIENYDDEYEFY